MGQQFINILKKIYELTKTVEKQAVEIQELKNLVKEAKRNLVKVTNDRGQKQAQLHLLYLQILPILPQLRKCHKVCL